MHADGRNQPATQSPECMVFKCLTKLTRPDLAWGPVPARGRGEDERPLNFGLLPSVHFGQIWEEQ